MVAVVVADPTVTVGSVVGAGDLKNYWVLLGVVLVEKLQGVPVGAFVVDCFQPKGCPELQSAAGAVLVVVVVAELTGGIFERDFFCFLSLRYLK